MSETAVVNACIHLITVMGGMAIRVNSGATVIDDGQHKRRMIRGAPVGTADILGMWRGRFLAVEVKVRPNKPTPAQADFLERVQAAGGLAYVAYDTTEGLQEFLEGV